MIDIYMKLLDNERLTLITFIIYILLYIIFCGVSVMCMVLLLNAECLLLLYM